MQHPSSCVAPGWWRWLVGPRGSAAAAPIAVLVVVVATTAAIVRRPAPVAWAVAFTAVWQQPVTGVALQLAHVGHVALAGHVCRRAGCCCIVPSCSCAGARRHSLSVIVVVITPVALVGRRTGAPAAPGRGWSPVHQHVPLSLPHPHRIPLGLPRGRNGRPVTSH